MKTQEVVQTPIDTLRPAKANARVHSKKQLKQIARSIQRYGFNAPVLIGELAQFEGVTLQVNVVAETDIALVRVDTAATDALLEAEPAFARWLLKSLAHQLRSTLDRIDGERILTAEDRVKRLLKEMVDRDGPALHVMQEALANYVAVSRVSMGAILMGWKKANHHSGWLSPPDTFFK
jgi:CRP-like cAMP-binding protein